jgi:hypothetical protein
MIAGQQLAEPTMPLLGHAALAMWWDMAPPMRAEFQHWHSHEHFAERMAIPGFLRGTRWGSADGGEGIFQMYELQAHEVLASPAYLARLNAPSAWSTSMMPHHRNMVRSQCIVLASAGGGIAGHAMTVRLSPATGQDAALRSALQALCGELAQRPGLTGAHLLRHQAPDIATTTEQKIRGANDRVADWVLVVCGYERAALDELAARELAAGSLVRLGAAPGALTGHYALLHSTTPADTA